MVNKNWKIELFILLIFLGCAKAALSQDSIKVYADPESITGLKASKFIESIDFLPLETNKLSKYSNGAQYQIAGEDIVIQNNPDNAIYLFDKQTGEYLYKFKNEQKKYTINSVFYAPLKNALLIKSTNKHYSISDKKALQLVKRWKGQDISKYVSLEWLHLDKNFKREKIRVPSIALNANITYFNGGFVYRNYSNDPYTNDSVLYRLVQYDANNQVKHQYFPYLNLHGLWSDYYKYSLPLIGNATLDDSCQLFQLDFNPTIYELKPDTLIEKYRFVFPMANVMPADFNSLSFKNNIDIQKYKDEHAKAFSDYYRIFEHGKYLLFGVSTLSYQNRQFLLLNNTLYDLEKITTDSSIFNLPPNLINSVFGQDKEFIYSVTNAATILKHKEALLKDEHVSPAFKKYLNVMTTDDNDIILRIKLK